jgi:hypothetical protein
MLKTWRNHQFLKAGLIAISLFCYAVMILHPVLAHSFTPSAAETVFRETVSVTSLGIGSSSEKISNETASQNDCPVCRHLMGNPAASFAGSPKLFLATAFYPPEQIIIFILPAQSIANRDSRAPPEA